MRSTILVTSALAAGALAGPLRKRDYVTQWDIETVIVYVTEGEPLPTAASAQGGFPSQWGGQGSGYAHPTGPYHPWDPQQSSSAASATSTVYVSVAASSSSAVVSSAAVSSAVVSSAPAYTPAPVSSAVASSSKALSSAVSSAVVSSAPVSSAAYSAAPSSSSTVAASSSAGNVAHSTGSIQATFTSGPDYQAAVVYHHNEARANHNAGELTWDDTCAENARIAAQKCTFAHYIPEGADEGQNIFTTSGDSFNVTAAITESWYKSEFSAMTGYWGKEIPDSVFESVGHLTQIVWKATTKVGCWSQFCDGNMTLSDGSSTDMNRFTVCNYASPGNVETEYAANVGSPISTTNLGSWLD